MSALGVTLPEDLVSVVDAYRTCEFLTVSRSGVPIAWPTFSVRRPDGTFLISTSIGLPQKAFNVRRNPAVALLFSDPTASGVDGAPAVLVQGTATCPDEIVTSVLPARELWKRIFDRQPSSVAYSKYGITRRMMDVYYLRLLITITPTLIRAVPALEASGPLSVARGRDRGMEDPFASAVNRLPQFVSAVLTAFDGQGSPIFAAGAAYG